MSKLSDILRFPARFCLALAIVGAGAAYAGELRMATTTSTENSGLLKVLLPKFEAATGVHVQVIAVGTGKAVKLGEAGDVDVVLVHARQLEDAFVASGGGIDRRDVMYNDFILVGPSADPAHVHASSNVIQGMEAIAAAGAKFVSRGDHSGTDVMEQHYWKTAGIDPKGKPWYVSAGLGMGEVLNMAAQINAYTLSDRATYGAYRARTGLDIVLAGDPRMFNPYGIIAVNPARHPGINYTDATRLIEWITSSAGQRAIAEFKVNGEQVFFPNYGKAVAGGK
ncbi:substrate-binding domain-containing protein [Ralstonia nicotianae]|uniref:Tungsten ABC transporter substrate-binding protein n=1 Tax=Ralstonia nicotianae TaxID=3037696 RepID=A0ABX7ZRX7_9RALS|nr:substrate-binding domain-containing protein [Ralstonia nicotianae]QUP58222.1 tungsten ABC transporter substrate-binding protein [Ralstonia nicotianae]